MIGHLGGPGGQDQSGQRRQVSGSTQVSRQQDVTHDDVVAQERADLFFVFLCS